LVLQESITRSFTTCELGTIKLEEAVADEHNAIVKMKALQCQRKVQEAQLKEDNKAHQDQNKASHSKFPFSNKKAK